MIGAGAIYSRLNKLGRSTFFQEQPKVVVSNLDLLGQTFVPHLKFHVVPRELCIAEEVLVDCEGPNLIFKSLTKFFSRLNNGGKSITDSATHQSTVYMYIIIMYGYEHWEQPGSHVRQLKKND